ncbi:DoxX family protein [Anaeromyxobacter sp. Fw109-5]|uniref:DoxX family protein n=1 Tax=Anaeromyxobacter sp. (strain Fw109-5) TaxID=404589 RepID=UPI000158A467|nr:hypothetical protein Anae109_1063 [Anaeromyxobacter sp. Fw109-5]
MEPLSWAKLLGVVLLLAPVPARLKEWSCAGFAVDLASAVVAHLPVGRWSGGLGRVVRHLAPRAARRRQLKTRGDRPNSNRRAEP